MLDAGCSAHRRAALSALDCAGRSLIVRLRERGYFGFVGCCVVVSRVLAVSRSPGGCVSGHGPFPHRERAALPSLLCVPRQSAASRPWIGGWLTWWITRRGSITLHARRQCRPTGRPFVTHVPRHCSLLARTPVSCRVKRLSVCQRKCSNAPRADWFCSEASAHIENTNINVENAF